MTRFPKLRFEKPWPDAPKTFKSGCSTLKTNEPVGGTSLRIISYEVGCVAEDGDRKKQVQYKNQIDACASFIKREIEDLRSL